jgi:ATP-dependent DNA helicase RecG
MILLKILLTIIKNKEGINRKEISKKLNISQETIKKQIIKLVKINLIQRKGSRKTGGYYIK